MINGGAKHFSLLCETTLYAKAKPQIVCKLSESCHRRVCVCVCVRVCVCVCVCALQNIASSAPSPSAWKTLAVSGHILQVVGPLRQRCLRLA